MSNMKIKCPYCKTLLAADDRYLRCTVSCGNCGEFFVLDPNCFADKKNTVPVFSVWRENSINSSEQSPYPESFENIKIGRLAEAVFRYIFENDLCSKKMLTQIQNIDYCSKTFHFKYPLVKIFNSATFKLGNSLSGKHCRYWKTPINKGDKLYFICSQWYEYCRIPLLIWLSEQGISYDKIKDILSPNSTHSSTEVHDNCIADAHDECAEKSELEFFDKPLDWSTFIAGITVPIRLHHCFLNHLSVSPLPKGKYFPVEIEIEGRIFSANILSPNFSNRKRKPVLQILWSRKSEIAQYFQGYYPEAFAQLSENHANRTGISEKMTVSVTDITDRFKIALSITKQPFLQATEKVSIDEISFSLDILPEKLSHTKPILLKIRQTAIPVKSWKEILLAVSQDLYQQDPINIQLLAGEKFSKFTDRICIRNSAEQLISPVLIAEDFWIETNFNATDTVRLAAEIVDFSGVETGSIEITYIKQQHLIAPTESSKEANTEDKNVSSGDAEFDNLLDKWGEDNL